MTGTQDNLYLRVDKDGVYGEYQHKSGRLGKHKWTPDEDLSSFVGLSGRCTLGRKLTLDNNVGNSISISTENFKHG